MSFFKKLKDRMFKSASKIDEGLDAIIEEGAADLTQGDAADAAAPGTPEAAPELLPPQAPIPPLEAPASKHGLLGRLIGRSAAPRRALDDEMLESLEELLIASDMGVDTALRVTANMAQGRHGKMMSASDIKGLLADEITRVMEPVARPLPI
jgi:fused signal recognition particle receptor